MRVVPDQSHAHCITSHTPHSSDVGLRFVLSRVARYARSVGRQSVERLVDELPFRLPSEVAVCAVVVLRVCCNRLTSSSYSLPSPGEQHSVGRTGDGEQCRRIWYLLRRGLQLPAPLPDLSVSQPA